MKLTPLDIRRQEFKRVVRGVDPEEVSVFLDMVAGEFERILRENKALNEERDELKRKVDELDSMKEAIQGAVVMARKSSDETVTQAKKEAELRLKEAEVESERILEDARRQAMLLKKEMDDIRNQRAILVGRLKSLLDGQMKMLEAYIGDWGHDERDAHRASRAEDYARANEPAPKPWTQEDMRQPEPAPPADHADFPPNAPSDPAHAPGVREAPSRRSVPEIVAPETEAPSGPETSLDESLRSPERPVAPDEARQEGELRPGPLQRSDEAERPHFLRPPRPMVDRE